MKPMTAFKKEEEILIFRTNISLKRDEIKIGRILNHLSLIRRWNIDREDCDNVLRVESSGISPEDLIFIITEAGYFCEELPD